LSEEKHDKEPAKPAKPAEPAKPDKESERNLEETVTKTRPLTEPDKLSERIVQAAKKEEKKPNE
jgi:hypothetical protein